MSDEILESGYPGVGRLYYFLAKIVMIVVSVFSVIYFGPESGVFRVVSLAAMIAGVVLDVMRLRNIGVSEWLVFLRFVPYASILLDVGLQSAQGGFAESRRLDKAGWAIVGVYAAVIALVIYLILRGRIEFGAVFGGGF